MKIVRVALVVPFAALVACARGGSTIDKPFTPAAPSAAIAASDGGSAKAASVVQGREEVRVLMQDACDPTTFNELQEGLCGRNGGVRFDQFIGQLSRFGFIAPWVFAPAAATVHVGQTLVATNRGGEVHTFTEVAEFGGGRVPFLNEILNLPNVAPECTTLPEDDFVPPGGVYREGIERTGTLKFQCCIHPWMKFEASSR
jgi:plastocyanin